VQRPANVGLAMFGTGGSSGPYGGYIRFAARDISNTANLNAFQYILNNIDPTGALEKWNVGKKDESAALYELYKYFNGLRPYAGSPISNTEADSPANFQQSLTAAGQGLTSGWAFKTDGKYNSPQTGCSKSYIIYVVNNGSTLGTGGQSSYEQQPGVDVSPALPPTPEDTAPPAKPWWTDEWTAYLYSQGIVTFVIDVYSAGNTPAYSQSLQIAAQRGGGQYFQAGSGPAIQQAISVILDQIQAVSSSFAAANLPINANSRTQDLNKVFIGMFQPDPNSLPRWYGNLKAYQLIVSGSDVVLGDAQSNPAVNPLTGFVTQCAVSFWTQDTSAYNPTGGATSAVPYWSIVPASPSMASTCPISGVLPYSDTPDGPFVAKGAAAEVLRTGNNPPTTNTAPTWNVNRNVWTLSSGGSRVPFSTTSTGLSQPLVNFITGYDVNDENANNLTDGTNGNSPETRPSIHGDVIHSQPLAVNYGGNTGVVVYYGANDGMLHAVSGGSGQSGPEPATSNAGQELWAFVAPEFLPRLNRLMSDSPTINYWGTPSGITPAPTAKDYFFDGSIGLYQDATSSNVWIYPVMRRGGRMLYGLDVSQPSAATVKWKLGCPDLGDDTGCTTGMTGIGQTWSTPRVAFLNGYSSTTPVVIVGGGYDSCEDANTASPTCTSAKGAAVYVIDADTGTVVATFQTDKSVAGDVSLVDMNYDGSVDFAYVADTGGNLYRITFVNPTDLTSIGANRWSITKIAYTGGGGRKFLYGPAVMPNGGQVYLAIGSGDREHPLQGQYPYTTPVVNRFYVYLDNLSATTASNLDSTSIMVDCTTTSNCSSLSLLPGGTPRGWFMSLTANGTGEQVVSGALIAGGMVSFGTNRPIPASVGTCATVLGEARGYWVNLLNSAGEIAGQARSSQYAAGGFPNTPQIATVLVGNAAYTVVSGAAELGGGASSPINFQRLTPPTSSKRKRVYWYTPIDN
jgi:type IV pilus assembly protein PilY1